MVEGLLEYLAGLESDEGSEVWWMRFLFASEGNTVGFKYESCSMIHSPASHAMFLLRSDQILSVSLARLVCPRTHAAHLEKPDFSKTLEPLFQLVLVLDDPRRWGSIGGCTRTPSPFARRGGFTFGGAI